MVKLHTKEGINNRSNGLLYPPRVCSSSIVGWLESWLHMVSRQFSSSKNDLMTTGEGRRSIPPTNAKQLLIAFIHVSL